MKVTIEKVNLIKLFSNLLYPPRPVAKKVAAQLSQQPREAALERCPSCGKEGVICTGFYHSDPFGWFRKARCILCCAELVQYDNDWVVNLPYACPICGDERFYHGECHRFENRLVVDGVCPRCQTSVRIDRRNDCRPVKLEI